MVKKFKLQRIDIFNQEKIILHGLSFKQVCILKALFVMINNNVAKDGTEFRKTLMVDGETYFDFNQWDIIDALPICKYKTKRQLQRDLSPLVSKGFIIKYPIETKYLIRLNIEELIK